MWQQYHTGTRQPCRAAQCRDRNRPWKHQGGDRRFARLSHRQPISLLPSAPVARAVPLALHTRAAAFLDLRILRVAINWSMTGNMRGHQATRWMSVRPALVLAPLLGVSASTSALPTDFSDVPGFTEPASSRPLWESPATSAPEVDPAAPSPHPVKREAMRGNPLWSVPLAALSNTNERPIFSASRRRPPPPVISVSAPKAPPMPPSPPPAELRLVLVGTVVGSDQSFGIFVDETSKATLRLKLDGDYQGWRLRSVHRREVTMVRGELAETLTFPKPGGAAPATGPALAESAVRRGSSHTPQYD